MQNFVETVKFDENGLVPVITQDCRTDRVLMMAYMDREALEKSLKTGMAHYRSRSRGKLWLKGETSGHYQHIKSIYVDCDNDALLMKVEQVEAACHTGHFSCFYRMVEQGGAEKGKCDMAETEKTVFDPGKVYPESSRVLQEVYDVIADRAANPKEGSYTNYLLEKGIDKILKKVGEESAEVIIAAKNKEKGEIVYEVSDLFYHLMVLMVERGIKLEDIYRELRDRR